MSPDTWKLIASIGGLLITAVTGPLIWALRAEGRAVRKEIDLARTEIDLVHTEIKLDLAEMEKRISERRFQ